MDAMQRININLLLPNESDFTMEVRDPKIQSNFIIIDALQNLLHSRGMQCKKYVTGAKVSKGTPKIDRSLLAKK